MNTFIDQETPDQISLVASGLPAGLSLLGKQISGTTSMSGVSSVTLTATDGGGLSTSTSFTITVVPASITPPPTGTFSITGVQTVSCKVVSAGQRRLTFNPRYPGLDGSPVSFSVVSEMLPTTNPGPYVLRLYTDNPIVTLQAQQGGVSSRFSYGWLSACTPGARQGAEDVSRLQVLILGNPVDNNQLAIKVLGASGSSLQLQLVDGHGRLVEIRRVEQLLDGQRYAFDVSHQPVGTLLLQAITPTQRVQVKILKK